MDKSSRLIIFLGVGIVILWVCTICFHVYTGTIFGRFLEQSNKTLTELKNNFGGSQASAGTESEMKRFDGFVSISQKMNFEYSQAVRYSFRGTQTLSVAGLSLSILTLIATLLQTRSKMKRGGS